MQDPSNTPPANPRGTAVTAADVELQAALCARLWDSGLDVSEIALNVAEGRVTIEGAVGTQADRAAIEASIRASGGVREVVNHVSVAPDRTGG
ncbi:BON domain-containing protein [Cupriavidus sp. L7L]|uniref:BON domain-containing protein n=1 Tax=Cupriavidus sp. L7L TaxID=2546443 RepID=UPI0010566E29|nr:BON domain-containing protein [Cupriavidus sp. L7L]TDF65529.1 BON domain-containing protein [Cupriavidus sp. L7L]